MIKRTLILLAVALLAAWFWFVVKPWIQDPTWSTVNYSTWLVPLIALMVASAGIATALTLLDDYQWRFGASGVVAATFLVLFGITKLNLLAVAVMFLFHFWAIRGLSKAIKNGLKVDFRAAVNHGMRNVITPLLIMLSFVYFANPDVQASVQQNQLPTSITRAVEGVSRFFASSELADLPPNQRARIEQELSQETLDLLNRQAGPYRQYFPPLLAFGLFLVLQGLSFLFIPIAGYIALGLYEVLRLTEFVHIGVKDVQAEVLTLDK